MWEWLAAVGYVAGAPGVLGPDYDLKSPFGQPGDLLLVFDPDMPADCGPIAAATLKVLRVWVERLQTISEVDCMREGITPMCNHATAEDVRMGFASLWDSIYAAKGLGWDENPWVWACEFERIDK